MGIFDSILKIAAPAAGFALGGPAGAMLGSGVSGAISGGQSQGKADKLTAQMLAQAKQRFQAGSPFRDKLAGLSSRDVQPQREDLSSIYSDPGDPYARRLPRPTAPRRPQGPPPVSPFQQQANDKVFADQLHQIRQSQGGGIGDRLAQQALAQYMAQNPNSQWRPGGPNDVMASPASPAPRRPIRRAFGGLR